MISYLARQSVAVFPLAFSVGLLVVVVVAVSGNRLAAVSIGVVLGGGLIEYLAARWWLRLTEMRDAKAWLDRENGH